MYCKECNNETPNPKFCSRTCSVRFHNRNSPKRKVEGECRYCNTPVSTRRVTCDDCSPNKVDWTKIKIKDMTQQRAYQRHSRIRTLARKVALASGVTSCSRCGYDKHVEVCHIKPIYSFSPDTTLSEVNDPTNLVILCPNCHWEFDNGLLIL